MGCGLWSTGLKSLVDSLRNAEVVLRVCAVGLNFHDVLNVLGEYPGDPGPPGADVAGTAGIESSQLRAAFGLGHAPLACTAIAAVPLLVLKPGTVTSEPV